MRGIFKTVEHVTTCRDNSVSRLLILVNSHKRVDNILPTNKNYRICALTKEAYRSASENIIPAYESEFVQKHIRSWGETNAYKYLLDNPGRLTPFEYVGFCHYRRFFEDFFFDTSSIPEILEQFGVIATYPTNHLTSDNCCNRRQLPMTVSYWFRSTFARYDFWDTIERILCEKYPDYVDSFHKLGHSMYWYSRNMVIMRKDILLDYMNFMVDVQTEFANVTGFIDDGVIGQWLIDNYPNADAMNEIRLKCDYDQFVTCNSRLIGFVGEILTHVYIVANGYQPYLSNILEFM